MEKIEDNHQPLLSICIPTYNRAEYLRKALENITSDPAFNESIEIVISDNASVDNTRDVGEEYSSRYKNIRYFRNEENMRDANFKMALHRARGKYLRLSNDTLRYRPGALSLMINKISESSEESGLFFYRTSIFSTPEDNYTVSDINGFLQYASYFIGWIANFGLWKADLDCLKVPRLYTELMFVQVAWTLEILKKHKHTTVYFGDFHYTEEPAKKGTYNLFKVQQSNLLRILRNYGLKGLALEREKYRLFRYHIFPLLYSYVYCKNETGFNLTEPHKTIIKEYWYHPYIYAAFLLGKLKAMLKKSAKVIKTITS